MTYESESISRAFYAALTPAGLAGRTRTEWDEIILRDLAELVPRASRILDVGCGYGRLAVPLAVAGHQVKGLDLSPTMIMAAQENAAAAGVSIPFVVGSMTDLPYDEGSFDVVLCLWSAFHELLEVDAQTLAIQEITRARLRVEELPLAGEAVRVAVTRPFRADDAVARHPRGPKWRRAPGVANEQRSEPGSDMARHVAKRLWRAAPGISEAWRRTASVAASAQGSGALGRSWARETA